MFKKKIATFFSKKINPQNKKEKMSSQGDKKLTESSSNTQKKTNTFLIIFLSIILIPLILILFIFLIISLPFVIIALFLHKFFEFMIWRKKFNAKLKIKLQQLEKQY